VDHRRSLGSFVGVEGADMGVRFRPHSKWIWNPPEAFERKGTIVKHFQRPVSQFDGANQGRPPVRRGVVLSRVRLAAVALAGCLLATVQSGCILSPMLRASELKGSHTVEAKYPGLDGKSFAVVVAADRSIQAEFPQLVTQLTTTVSRRLADECNASGWIPPEKILEYQYKNPGWAVMAMDDLAKALEVDRVVYVEVSEFRLNEPGNQYLWNAAASALVGVVERDSVAPESFAYRERVQALFPTKETGLGPAQMSANVVQLALAKKFVNRIAWLFYTHDQKNVETDEE
jgi:hypothetical protein